MPSVPLRAVAIAAGLLALSGCAVSRPPVTSTTLRADVLPAIVRLDATGETATKLTEALVPLLAARGITVDSAAVVALTVAASEYDAGIGVTLGGGDVVAVPRKHRWYHACPPQRLTASLMLRHADEAGPRTLVRGSVDDCRIDEQAIGQLAAALANAL